MSDLYLRVLHTFWLVMSLLLSNAKRSSAAKRLTLPMAAFSAVLVAPLLMSAGRPPALEDSISATCSLEDDRATSSPAQREGATVSYRRAQSEPAEAVSEGDRGLPAFVRDRWNSVRRLIRENPYLRNSTPAQQAQVEALCLAQIQSDYEVLIAQADEGELMALPDLSSSPSSPTPEATPAPASNATSNGRSDRPEASPVVPPATSQPAQFQRSTSAPSVDPATLPTAQDPSTYSGPDFEPTPFDGTVIRTLADMPDGNYRYIAGDAKKTVYSNEELQQRGGSVFVLSKAGDTVTGDLLPKIGLPGICVTGTVSGDVITGAAYPYDTTDTLQDSARQIGENYEPHGSGALKIRRTRTDGNRLYYAGALLDLSSFTPINAGSSLPPTSCQIGRTGGRDQG